MTAKTMAEVLAEHHVGSYLVGSHAGIEHMPDIGVYESRCYACGTVTGSTAEHQAAALSAAGFGLVAAAKAEALEEAAAIFAGRLPNGTGNGRAYNSYQVANMLRARAAALRGDS